MIAQTRLDGKQQPITHLSVKAWRLKAVSVEQHPLFAIGTGIFFHLMQKGRANAFSPLILLHEKILHFHRIVGRKSHDAGDDLTVFFQMKAVILFFAPKGTVKLPKFLMDRFLCFFVGTNDLHSAASFPGTLYYHRKAPENRCFFLNLFRFFSFS